MLEFMSKETSVYKIQGLTLRANVIVALFNSDGEIFVGDLEPRASDMRAYSSSLIEGGVDKGESPATAFFREPWEEVGFECTKPIAFYRYPMVCMFEDWKTAKKFSGKAHIVGGMLVSDGRGFCLAGNDAEGPTFNFGQWMSLEAAEEYLKKRTTSPMRKEFIAQLMSVLRPIRDNFQNKTQLSVDYTSKPPDTLPSLKAIRIPGFNY